MTKDRSLLGAYMAVSGVILVAGALGVILFVWAFPPPFEHSAFEYLGSASCGECHQAQVEFWERTHMAASFAVLRPGERADSKRRSNLDPNADYTHDPRCLRCHTTGGGLVGGFVSFEETPQMAGVSCEACHGPGGRYAGTRLSPARGAFEGIRDVSGDAFHHPDDAACRRCHNEESPIARGAHSPAG